MYFGQVLHLAPSISREDIREGHACYFAPVLFFPTKTFEIGVGDLLLSRSRMKHKSNRRLNKAYTAGYHLT